MVRFEFCFLVLVIWGLSVMGMLVRRGRLGVDVVFRGLDEV